MWEKLTICHFPAEFAQFWGQILINKQKNESTPINCSMAAWSSWSSCSRSCNGGFSTRSRKITEQPSKDGLPCASREERRDCNTESCPGEDPSRQTSSTFINQKFHFLQLLLTKLEEGTFRYERPRRKQPFNRPLLFKFKPQLRLSLAKQANRRSLRFRLIVL